MRFPFRPFPLAAALALSVFTPSVLRADTILLNDGTELEGKILEETDTYLKVEVQVSKSIKDTKIIQRSDIKLMTKETPDSELFEKIQSVFPTRDRLNVTDYEELLNLNTRRFATEFPSSRLLPKVRELEAKLEEEKAKVAAGSIQLGGKWVSPEEIAADPYNHEANLLASDVTNLLAEDNLTGAFQAFENLETNYTYATAIAPVYAPVLKALDTYEGTIKRALRENPIKLAEREKQLTSLDPQGKQAAQASFNRELQNFQAEWETARAAKQKWLPISVWDKKSLDDASKVVASEKTRLAKVDTTVRARAAALLALSFTALSEGKFEAAALQLDKAAEAGVDTKTVTAIRAKVASAQTAAEAAASIPPTTPETETDPSTETPAPETPKETMPEETPAPPATPEKTVTPPVTESTKPDKPAPAKSSAKDPLKNTARNLDGLVDDPDSEETVEKEPAISFQTILFILVGVMIAITVLAKVFSRPAPEDFEEAVAEDEDENAR